MKNDNTFIEMPSGAEAAGSRNLVARVVYDVRRMIRNEGLKIGDALPSEAVIGERLGVSRAVVREAYRSLAALRLIDVGNGRRARVCGIDNEVLALAIDHAVQVDQITIQQILDVRRTIEMRTVALAALHRTQRQAARISGLAAAMRADFHQADKVMEHDIAFHEAIAGASRNPMFALIVSSFHVVTRQTWRIGWVARESDEDRYASVECHEAIAAAISDGDPGRAAKHMAEHFDNTVALLLATGIN